MAFSNLAYLDYCFPQLFFLDGSKPSDAAEEKEDAKAKNC